MDDQSGWEYEYDPHETEDLYFTIDLTTHVPGAIPTQLVPRNGKRTPKAPESRPTGDSAPGHVDFDAEPRPMGTLQLLDLHSTDPLVRFEDSVYSCNWHTDLGTQIFVGQRGGISQPVRPGHVLDVIGTSQTRLLGRPVKLFLRNDRIDDTPKISPQDPADIPDSGPKETLAATLPPSDLSDLRPGQQLVIPLDAIKDPRQLAQASFLERLSTIKLQKGELDIIPVAGVKHYSQPAKKEEIRQRAIATAAVMQNTLSANEPPTIPKVGKRKRRSYAQMGIETKKLKHKRLKQEALLGKAPLAPPPPASPAPGLVSGHVDSTASSRPAGSTLQYDLPATFETPEESTVAKGDQLDSGLPGADPPPVAIPRSHETETG
ncbi:hypothetical protein LTR35_016651 [Friedmanniomyces endolithicus]|uniref:Transcription factor TFIIIC triple barrel domain-containing protein n=1 Tax=Friedmanniomyces endolithicus TaxID=329885 RepID=A0AAN6FJ69_9PEZI|nr:hypothetical protein LTR35_016651 [Friedmanniomyces endolithicus]KAK0287178.1 hypothetical protein LTS00_010216 [Friedmanniomyces endolithicus]KAK0317566.1 hypothetical protein LTR82_011335 [Friedmanniomyces endolithicus]KAK0994146.1 hypothetical protein LTR54_010821 [Friedmanniomyces endolithicus]